MCQFIPLNWDRFLYFVSYQPLEESLIINSCGFIPTFNFQASITLNTGRNGSLIILVDSFLHLTFRHLLYYKYRNWSLIILVEIWVASKVQIMFQLHGITLWLSYSTVEQFVKVDTDRAISIHNWITTLTFTNEVKFSDYALFSSKPKVKVVWTCKRTISSDEITYFVVNQIYCILGHASHAC